MLNPKSKLSGNAGGFTLIEVVVVVLLLGILAAMVIPQARNTRQDAVIAAAEQAAQGLQFAQSEAQKLNTPITVSFDIATNHYTISGPDGLLTNPATHEPYDIDPRTTTGEPELDITAAEFGTGKTSITFSPSGEPLQGGTTTPVTQGNAVVFGCGGFSRTINVTPVLGKITVTENGNN